MRLVRWWWWVIGQVEELLLLYRVGEELIPRLEVESRQWRRRGGGGRLGRDLLLLLPLLMGADVGF